MKQVSTKKVSGKPGLRRQTLPVLQKNKTYSIEDHLSAVDGSCPKHTILKSAWDNYLRYEQGSIPKKGNEKRKPLRFSLHKDSKGRPVFKNPIILSCYAK